MKTGIKIKKISGIQKKFLVNMLMLLILALLLSSIGVLFYVRKNVGETTVDKYEFMTEKMGISLDNLYEKSDEITAECIMEENVQKSLKTKELEKVEKNTLSKYFAYIDMDGVAEYCYVDNKENVYAKSYSNTTYKDFVDSGFTDILSDSYAKTEWVFQKDTLFHTEEEALFIARNVHSMDYAHAPGALILKMDESFLRSAVEEKNAMEEAAVGIIDSSGTFCMERYPEDSSISREDREKIISLAKSGESGMILRRAGCRVACCRRTGRRKAAWLSLRLYRTRY